MTLITFDDKGNPTIQMDYKDVCPVSTEAYMRTLEQHLIDYSMVEFVTVEASMVELVTIESLRATTPDRGILEYRRLLIDCADTVEGLVKITDYTVTTLPHDRIRLAGTGIVFDLEKLKNLYLALKQVENLPGTTKESGAADDSFDLLI